jgi:hypothetical protein
LKKDTLARRRMRRSKDSKAAKVASQQILGNYLQRQVVAQRLQRQTQAMIKKLNARMGDLLTLKKAKTAGICINFYVGKCFFVVFLFSGGVLEQPEEAQEIFEEELIDQLCPPEVCR